jgi:ribosome maturation protein Sdo1
MTKGLDPETGLPHLPGDLRWRISPNDQGRNGLIIEIVKQTGAGWMRYEDYIDFAAIPPMIKRVAFGLVNQLNKDRFNTEECKKFVGLYPDKKLPDLPYI